VNATDIFKLIESRHSTDLVVGECKDGPTQSVMNYLRMDAWVMPRSWAHPAITAYEIKVSRQDFLNDDKWRSYLPLCNFLYFAAAPDVIQQAELPPEVGLMEASKNAGRLFMRRKAIYREIPEPSSVFRYVLMCRAHIKDEDNGYDKRTFWEEWLKKRKVDHEFGYTVGKRIKQVIDEEINVVKRKNAELEERISAYDNHLEFLKRMGIDPKIDDWRFRDKIKEMLAGFSSQELHSIETCRATLTQLGEKIRQHTTVGAP
jgi:hypothetical protein